MIRESDKKFQNKKFVQISPSLILKTRRALYSVRGMFFDTSERSPRTNLLDVE